MNTSRHVYLLALLYKQEPPYYVHKLRREQHSIVFETLVTTFHYHGWFQHGFARPVSHTCLFIRVLLSDLRGDTLETFQLLKAKLLKL